MFQTLTLKNFQTHKSLEVDLDPHVTTIVGPSDVGKSSVIRALKWLATNKPSGDTFIRDGSKSTSVHLTADDRLIQRKRGGSTNSYSLDEQEFKAFGNDVPPEVLQVLNLSEINFQDQHDSPFWFCETSGEVSRQLNKIVDLTIIDTTLANLDKAGREARGKIRVIEERVKDAKALRHSLKHARKMDAQLTEVEGLHQEWCSLVEGSSRLGALLSQVRSYRDTAKRSLDVAEGAKGVIILGEAWSEVHGRELGLMRLVDEIEGLQKVAHQAVPDVEPLIKLKKAAIAAEEKREELEHQIRGVLNAQERAAIQTDAAEKAQKEWDKMMKGACPLCGRTG